MQDETAGSPAPTVNPQAGTPLLDRMESLLAEWRLHARPAPAAPDIPLLTDTLPDGDDAYVADAPPLPGGISREVFQAHLAVAAEKVMLALYRDLSTDLNERIADEMRRAVDLAIARAVRNLRQQVLISVAESLTQSIEKTGWQPAGRNDEPHPKSKP